MSQPIIFDLSPLLIELDQTIAEAERALRVAQLRLTHARGRKAGMLKTMEEMQRQAAPRPRVGPAVEVED